jgi:hypothetical protein
LRPALWGAGLAALAGVAQAQPSFNGHYPIGVEGLKAGSAPPPGIYLRDYNLFYYADRYEGGGVPDDFEVFVYAQAPRLIWISDLKILGGNYGADTIIPFLYTDLKVGGFKDSSFGMGDMVVEPFILSWHWQKFDLTTAYGFWAPTGDADPPPTASPGDGYWGHMFTLGGTWFPDAEKTWSVSLLSRYEINLGSEEYPSGVWPHSVAAGDELSVEWGIGKSLSKTVELGVVGYYQQQVTEDHGTDASSDLDRVLSIGPEINFTFPKPMLNASLRYYYEFDAQDRPEGHTLTLTLTKRF